MDEFLINKIIKNIKIADDNFSLLFECEDGNFVARCYEEYCSNTWIENVDLPANPFPAKVLDCENLELNYEETEKSDVIRYYGYKIKTDKGDITIDYRNESNGSYGGDLIWFNENHIRTSSGATAKENWVQLK
jgi:hypothetical protein